MLAYVVSESKNVPPLAAELSAMQKNFPEPLSAVNTTLFAATTWITVCPAVGVPARSTRGTVRWPLPS